MVFIIPIVFNMDFSKCTPSSSEYDLDGTFLHFLRQLELSLQLCYDSFHDLVILSAFRSIQHEQKMGRTGDSVHCLGKAVDIECKNNSHRYHIINYCLRNKISRIGVYKNFIHIDMGTYKDRKSEFVIWYG